MSSSGSQKVVSQTLTKVAAYILVSVGVYLVVMVLAVIIHLLLGIDYYELTYSYFSHFEYSWTYPYVVAVYKTGIYEIDIATYIVVGALDLITTVLFTLFLAAGMILVWVINSFIFGVDEYGNVLNPISLFQILALVPLIGDFFGGLTGLSESLITDWNNVLTIFRTMMQNIMSGIFVGISGIWNNLVENFLGRPRTPVSEDSIIFKLINGGYW